MPSDRDRPDRMDRRPTNATQRRPGHSEALDLYNIGDMMYAEGTRRPTWGRILDLPISPQFTAASGPSGRFADRDLQPNIIVNTTPPSAGVTASSPPPTTTRSPPAPDLFICLVDNIEVVHHRLHRDFDIDATLKDCMVWRGRNPRHRTPQPGHHGAPRPARREHRNCRPPAENERRRRKPNFYIVSRGRHNATTRTMFRLACRPTMQGCPSLPMSHVVDMPGCPQGDRRLPRPALPSTSSPSTPATSTRNSSRPRPAKAKEGKIDEVARRHAPPSAAASPATPRTPRPRSARSRYRRRYRRPDLHATSNSSTSPT